MRVDLITVAYGLAADTDALVRRVLDDSKHKVRVHLFLHSQYEDVVKVCKALKRRKAVSLYDYGVNRGLAKSINEGLVAAYGGDDPADVVIVANDDLLPELGAFDLLAEAAADMPDKYLVCGQMDDLRTGKVLETWLHFCAITRQAYDTVGMFDENFFPIYYDDVDWMRRSALLGLAAEVVDGVRAVHQGSANIHRVEGMMAQHHVTFKANRAYYVRKWGGDIGHERYTRPFDQPGFDLRITPFARSAPYGRFNRDDQHIVEK